MTTPIPDSFPVNSISIITLPCRRFSLDVMQRSGVAQKGLILFGGVYNCRKIAGSNSWSEHSFGNAVDLFCHEADMQQIGDAVVRQTTKTTKANGGMLVPVHYVIITGSVWTADRGWHPYTGYHPPTHVHVDFDPLHTGQTPACAG